MAALYWTEDSILNNQTDKTSPADIFAAFCEAIGKYFEHKGFRYTRSRPRIRFETDDLFLDINFWSFRTNMAGLYVTVEILPYVGSKKLKKWIKENKMGRNEFIFAPLRYGFRTINVYGISHEAFGKLINQIESLISSQINIVNNEEFIDSLFMNDCRGTIRDNFACYLAMTRDNRLTNYIEDNIVGVGSPLSFNLKNFR
ncbi:hypothetical protein [Terrimonas pollutisoli]|uniref:hypothetical protein n=1 Tax=Terrimonas pollutisoli TaxID=3034147 RepID=UPI0023EE0FD0|nr:hypothetical protein [Terrimonas sp. H1YJ31]